MRFGVCTNKDFDLVAKAGYDYIETAFVTIANQSDAEFDAFARTILDTGLKAETFNCFFFGDIKLIGDGIDLKRIEEFSRRGMKRAAMLGGEVAVIGSGNARRIPEGFDREKATEQFVEILRLCGDIAGENGMKIVVEPLNPKETNFINTVQDGLELSRRVDHPNVGALVDFYHMYLCGESEQSVASSGGAIIHAHLARANEDRGFPVTEEDLTYCKKWAQSLKDCGYDGRLSLECIWHADFNESILRARKALELFR